MSLPSCVCSVFMEILGEKSRHSLQESLHLITAPTQVIWGKEDQVSVNHRDADTVVEEEQKQICLRKGKHFVSLLAIGSLPVAICALCWRTALLWQEKAIAPSSNRQLV